ncbi:MAG: hypothetical protein WDN72_02640 [Alphaproteobacteria bacterium]
MARYIPFLRWKRGEKIAIGNLSVSAKQNVVPLICLATDQYTAKAATATRPAMTAAEAFIDELLAKWGATDFYLDASGVGQGAVHHPIIDIAASARARNARLIPATSLTAPLQYQQAVANVVLANGTGVGLRVDLQDVTSAATWIGSWPHPVASTDLIADFSNSMGMVAALGASVDHAFGNLHLGNQWRTVTMAGTSNAR